MDTKRRKTYDLGDHIYHAFLWQNGKMRDLGALGARESYAYGISGRGQIVGWAGTISGIARAFLWENGKMRRLSIRGLGAQAIAINDDGQIAGTSARAFLWQNGRMRDLGALGGRYSEASAINERGQVVGRAFTKATDNEGNPIYHAFVWQNGTMRDLGALGGRWSWAYGINDRGQVVGQADTKANDESSKYGDPIYHAFLWQKGNIRDLARSARYSTAYGINDRGQVVGSVMALGENQSERAVLWQDGNMIELTILPGHEASRAVAINNRGQIVGWSEMKTGEKHAVLWTLRRG